MSWIATLVTSLLAGRRRDAPWRLTPEHAEDLVARIDAVGNDPIGTAYTLREGAREAREAAEAAEAAGDLVGAADRRAQAERLDRAAGVPPRYPDRYQ